MPAPGPSPGTCGWPGGGCPFPPAVAPRGGRRAHSAPGWPCRRL